jgi:hypothetical protein
VGSVHIAYCQNVTFNFQKKKKKLCKKQEARSAMRNRRNLKQKTNTPVSLPMGRGLMLIHPRAWSAGLSQANTRVLLV